MSIFCNGFPDHGDFFPPRMGKFSSTSSHILHQDVRACGGSAQVDRQAVASTVIHYYNTRTNTSCYNVAQCRNRYFRDIRWGRTCFYFLFCFLLFFCFSCSWSHGKIFIFLCFLFKMCVLGTLCFIVLCTYFKCSRFSVISIAEVRPMRNM